MDAVSVVTPHVKFATRPTGVDFVPAAVVNAYRTAWYGRPGPTFVDLPADILSGKSKPALLQRLAPRIPLAPPPTAGVDAKQLEKVARVLRTAKAPLLVLGKGVAYARAEKHVRSFVDPAKVVVMFIWVAGPDRPVRNP